MHVKNALFSLLTKCVSNIFPIRTKRLIQPPSAPLRSPKSKGRGLFITPFRCVFWGANWEYFISFMFFAEIRHFNLGSAKYRRVCSMGLILDCHTVSVSQIFLVKRDLCGRLKRAFRKAYRARCLQATASLRLSLFSPVGQQDNAVSACPAADLQPDWMAVADPVRDPSQGWAGGAQEESHR